MIAALLIQGPATAGAAVGCSFVGGTAAVTVSAPNEAATISRSPGGSIVIGGSPCGTATVTNTSKVTVTGALGGQVARIDSLSGGSGNDTVAGNRSRRPRRVEG